MKPFDKDEAKKFMTQAGDDFESEGRRLVKDDFAAIRQIKNTNEVHEALIVLTLALHDKEITEKEHDEAMKLIRQFLRTINRAASLLLEQVPRLTANTVRQAEEIDKPNVEESRDGHASAYVGDPPQRVEVLIKREPVKTVRVNVIVVPPRR